MTLCRAAELLGQRRNTKLSAAERQMRDEAKKLRDKPKRPTIPASLPITGELPRFFPCKKSVLRKVRKRPRRRGPHAHAAKSPGPTQTRTTDTRELRNPPAPLHATSETTQDPRRTHHHATNAGRTRTRPHTDTRAGPARDKHRLHGHPQPNTTQPAPAATRPARAKPAGRADAYANADRIAFPVRARSKQL